MNLRCHQPIAVMLIGGSNWTYMADGRQVTAGKVNEAVAVYAADGVQTLSREKQS